MFTCIEYDNVSTQQGLCGDLLAVRCSITNTIHMCTTVSYCFVSWLLLVGYFDYQQAWPPLQPGCINSSQLRIGIDLYAGNLAPRKSVCGVSLSDFLGCCAMHRSLGIKMHADFVKSNQFVPSSNTCSAGLCTYCCFKKSSLIGTPFLISTSSQQNIQQSVPTTSHWFLVNKVDQDGWRITLGCSRRQCPICHHLCDAYLRAAPMVLRDSHW